MASLLDDSQKAVFTAALDTLFDTFKQDVVIYKEAKVQLINVNKPKLFGYSEEVDLSNINYIPITGIYPAMVSFAKKQTIDNSAESNNSIEQGEVMIKVKSDAKDFIESNGKTLNISIGDVMFRITSSESFRRFLSSSYYVYHLERDV